MSPTLAALAVVAALIGGYLLVCLVWPYASCRRCSGKGKFTMPLGRSWRSCRRCAGSGRRVRAGARLMGRGT